MTHVRTAPYDPQSNDRLERFHKTIKGDAIRPKALPTADEARSIVTAFAHHSNTERLHSAIDDVTPADRLADRHAAITAERDRRFDAARERRAQWRQAARGATPASPPSTASLDSHP